MIKQEKKQLYLNANLGEECMILKNMCIENKDNVYSYIQRICLPYLEKTWIVSPLVCFEGPKESSAR